MWYMENNKLGISVWGRGGKELLFVLIYSELNASWEVWLSLYMRETTVSYVFLFFSKKTKEKTIFWKTFFIFIFQEVITVL